MVKVTVQEAQSELSRLLKRVEAGEEVVITEAEKPLAKLVRADGGKRPRQFGLDAGAFEIPEDFDEPLPEFEEYM